MGTRRSHHCTVTRSMLVPFRPTPNMYTHGLSTARSSSDPHPRQVKACAALQHTDKSWTVCSSVSGMRSASDSAHLLSTKNGSPVPSLRISAASAKGPAVPMGSFSCVSAIWLIHRLVKVQPVHLEKAYRKCSTAQE